MVNKIKTISNKALLAKNENADTEWIDKELAGCKFKDERLGKRFKNLFSQMSSSIGETIPFACQDWANTKAAYRFFSNDRVNENEILKGHFQSTRDRFTETTGPILILQDTTDFSYKRERPHLIGSTHQLPQQVKANIRKVKGLTMCGILMHSSIAVTTNGLPLGLAAVKFWTRKKFKGTNALKKHINPTRMPIEKKRKLSLVRKFKAINRSIK